MASDLILDKEHPDKTIEGIFRSLWPDINIAQCLIISVPNVWSQRLGLRVLLS